MTPLITSLEQAGEGSRELDGLVEVAIRSVFAARSGLERQHWAKWASVRGTVSDGHTIYDSNPVTTCVTAALALANRVLPGWSWTVLGGGDDATGNAELYGPKDGYAFAIAPTPALALCLAILRATNPKGQPNV